MSTPVILNGRELLTLIQESEDERRRERFEHRTGAVHQRRNIKDRRVETVDSNSKRGQQWKREVW